MDVFSVKKVFLGGGAVIAATLLALSAAWACSPYAFHQLPTAAEGPAGTSVRILGYQYELEYGPVRVVWSNGADASEVELDRPVLKYVEDHTDGEGEVHRFHEFTSNVTVPKMNPRGFLYVVQRAPNSSGLRTLAFTVTPDPAVPVSTTTTLAAPVTTPPSPAPTVARTEPAPIGGLPVPRPVVTPGAAAAPVVQRDAPPVAPAVTVEVGGTGAAGSEVPGAPGTREASGVVTRLDPAGVDVQTLWSGLRTSDGLNGASLIEPRKRATDDTSRLGVGLLTLGAVALVGGALVVRPLRRRALA